MEDSKHFRPPQNKTPCYTRAPSLSKVTIRNVGYAKRIKDAYPKKVCHMLKRHVKKRRVKELCIPKEGMPHAHKACQKKEEKKRER